MTHSRTPLAIALVGAIIAAPSATAVIPHEGGQAPDPSAATVRPLPPDRLDGPSAATVRPVPPDRLDGPLATPQVQPQLIVGESRDAFDWSDAGIGFAAAAGLALLGSGSLATVRWRRHVRTPAH